MDDNAIDSLAKQLYEYAKLNQAVQPADAIIALGNMDIRTAQRAAELYDESLAPVVVTSGGMGRLTPKDWTKPEGVIFAEELYKLGVPRSDVLVEDISTNIPQNIEFALEVLKEVSLKRERLILVCLPFGERRILALCEKQFPDIHIQITSMDITYEEYVNNRIDRNETINLIVGELDRLDKFPAKGFSVFHPIPKHIADAMDALITAGFDK